jgi:hypothetical protein
MAAAGLIFLASKYHNIKKTRDFLGEASIEKTKKQNKVSYTFLPYSTLVLLTPCPLNIEKGPHCAESSLKVVKFATRQKPFDL